MNLLSNSYDSLYPRVTRQVLLPSTLTSLSAYDVTYGTTSCFLRMYACPAIDGNAVAHFLTVNFPLITPGTPKRKVSRPQEPVVFAADREENSFGGG